LGICSLGEIKKELDRSRAAFEHYLGERDCLVKTFAYPYGSIPRDKEKRALINSYYPITLAAWGGFAKDPNSESFNTEEMPRIEISTNLNRDVLRKGNILQKKRTGDD
nr:hypothetical protein [Nanoarchaeota archaeon]